MKRIYLVLLFPLVAFATRAEDIRFAFRPVPPYVTVDSKGALSGMEFEIISAALAIRGNRVLPSTMSLARVVETFRTGGVDAAAPILPTTNSGGFLSDVYLVYNNVAMALKSRNLRIHGIPDLEGHSIAAFQTASRILGDDYAAAVKGDRYYEAPEQSSQIRLLFSGRVDLVVGESRILHALIGSLGEYIDPTLPVEEFRIFPPTAYRVAFRDAKLAADFNAGLATIRKDGTYEAIMARYGK